MSSRRIKASPAAWMQETRTRTSTTDGRTLSNAAGAFAALPIEVRMRLAREVAEARGPELCQAYRNIVAVSAGFKRKRPKGSRIHSSIAKTPCVILVVRKKLGKRALSASQRLPGLLLVHETVAGERVLCAVPTDVMPADGLNTAHAQAASGLYAGFPDNFREVGNATCAVEVRSGSIARTLMLSCQHVLSPFPVLGPQSLRNGVRVFDVADILRKLQPAQVVGGSFPPNQPVTGQSSRFGGRLLAGGQPSFDAQLAEMTDANSLIRALDGLELSSAQPFLRSVGEFDQIAASNIFMILVSPHNPFWLQQNSGSRPAVRATFVQFRSSNEGIDYDVRTSNGIGKASVFHLLLMELRIMNGLVTLRGDSGSPVVMRAADGKFTLVGMHIAGAVLPDGNYSCVLPSWQLFHAPNYLGLPAGSSLRPIARLS